MRAAATGAFASRLSGSAHLEPNWLPFFAVESAADAARKAEQLAGRRLMPTRQISIGPSAVVADPQGASFAVFEGETDP